jgi:hypothetical protein
VGQWRSDPSVATHQEGVGGGGSGAAVGRQRPEADMRRWAAYSGVSRGGEGG